MADDDQQRLDAAKDAGQREQEQGNLQADARWFSESMVMQRGLFDKLTIEQLRYFSFAAAKLMHKRLGEKLAESREQIETDSRLIRERDDMLFKHDSVLKETRTAIRDVANEVGVEFEENAPLKPLYAMRDEVRALRAQLGAEKSTAMAVRAQVNPLIATGRSMEEKTESLKRQLDQTEVALRKYQDACDQAFQQGWAGVGSQPILPDFTRPGDDKAEAIVKLAKAYVALDDEAKELRNDVGNANRRWVTEHDRVVTVETGYQTLRTENEKLKAENEKLSIERAGLQVRLRAQEDPRDEKVLNEAATRFLAIFGSDKPTFGGVQERVGAAFREVLGILREAALAKPEQIAKPEEISDGTIEMVLLGALVRAKNHAGTPRWLEEQAVSPRAPLHRVAAAINRMLFRGDIVGGGGVYTLAGEKLAAAKAMVEAIGVMTPADAKPTHPPISTNTQCGGVERCDSGDYVWWFSEMCAVKLRVEKRSDHQGIPSWALRQIADDMDRIAAEPPKPEPTADEAKAAQNGRVLVQRTRILAAADNTPRGFNDLWRRAGSPKYDDSYAFDIALGQLEGEGKLKVEDINGSKGYRLP